VNVTVSGADPVISVPLNCATGTAAVDGVIPTKINTKTASKIILVDFILFAIHSNPSMINF
jgi:hypothetical protein